MELVQFTTVLNFLDTHLNHGRYESVLRLDQGRQINAKHSLNVLHVRQTVVGNLLRTLLVSIQPTV